MTASTMHCEIDVLPLPLNLHRIRCILFQDWLGLFFVNSCVDRQTEAHRENGIHIGGNHFRCSTTTSNHRRHESNSWPPMNSIICVLFSILDNLILVLLL